MLGLALGTERKATELRSAFRAREVLYGSVRFLTSGLEYRRGAVPAQIGSVR